MVKGSLLVFIAFLVGFCVVIIAYLYLPKQYTRHMSTYLPTQPRTLTTHFSLEKAPSQSVAGTIINSIGKVFWQSRTADISMPITKDQKIQQGESIQTVDGSASVVFATILTVQVEKSTQLNIIQTLPSQFVIQQVTGTAEYETTNTTPIAIRSLDLLIACITTQLTVTVDKENGRITGAISKGSVTVAYTDTNNVTQTISIHRGQSFVYHNNAKELIVR